MPTGGGDFGGLRKSPMDDTQRKDTKMHDAVTEALRRVRLESLPTVPEPLAVPKIVVPERVVGEDVLPRGPKTVAKAVDARAWGTVWTHSEAELLATPKRGGAAYGLRFTATRGNRRGWAVWIDGAYSGGFLYCGGIVPVRLSAKALKELLARCPTS